MELLLPLLVLLLVAGALTLRAILRPGNRT